MMKELNDYLEVALVFHGHKCPAMPMGLRAGLAAMKVLGVKRAQDKELVVESETGEGHAAGCFLDGVMVATGATYGKGNIKKLFYNKMAFTLIDVKTGKAVRVSLKPEFVVKMVQSPFVQKRKEGIPPQDIPPEITNPQVERVLSLPESEFLVISEIFQKDLKKGATSFEVKLCAQCGEATFVNKLSESPDGRLLCVPCIEQERKA
ncbi:MAG: FmdE family protein [Proteobacteria bacterium]|nr:FmdE family protein [Pseudomonadota bacterium]